MYRRSPTNIEAKGSKSLHEMVIWKYVKVGLVILSVTSFQHILLPTCLVQTNTIIRLNLSRKLPLSEQLILYARICNDNSILGTTNTFIWELLTILVRNKLPDHCHAVVQLTFHGRVMRSEDATSRIHWIFMLSPSLETRKARCWWTTEARKIHVTNKPRLPVTVFPSNLQNLRIISASVLYYTSGVDVHMLQLWPAHDGNSVSQGELVQPGSKVSYLW